jgi:hypothetical protein
MSKWVEVPVTINKTFAVEISNEQTIDDAIAVATEECMFDDVTIEEGNCFMADTEQQAEQIKRLSDEKIAL